MQGVGRPPPCATIGEHRPPGRHPGFDHWADTERKQCASSVPLEQWHFAFLQQTEHILCVLLPTAWPDPNETQLPVFCNCLCHRDSLGIGASDTLCWRGTSAPNGFKTSKSPVCGKWSRHNSAAARVFPGEQLHLERQDRLRRNAPQGRGALCGPCLGTGWCPVLTLGRGRGWVTLQGISGCEDLVILAHFVA